MTRIQSFFKKYQPLIQTVFFISIFLLVLTEFHHLGKTISLKDVVADFSQLPAWKIIAMVVTGLLAVLPMLYFDKVLNEQLQTSYSKTYLFETSWAINTINNLVGFAGLVDIGLRYSFYVDSDNEELGRQEISRVIPYFMTGFSLLCGLTLLSFVIFPISASLTVYWPLLLAIFLYLPAIYLLSGRKNQTYFRRLPLRQTLELLIASSLDWIGVFVTFILVGKLLGVAPPIYHLLPLLLIAHAIGMVSMIPGGIGSFDLFVITGLAGMGVSNTEAVAWLLLFRVSYYLIPFFIGVILFFKQMGGRLNDKFLGFPKQITTTLLAKGQVVFLRFFAFCLLLNSLSTDGMPSQVWLHRMDPIHSHLIGRFPGLLLALAFLLLARLVQRRFRLAFPFGLGLIVASFLYLNLSSFSLITSSILSISLIILLWMRSSLDREGFLYAWEDVTKDSLLVIFSFLLHLYLEHSIPSHHRVPMTLGHYVTLWFHVLLLLVVTVVLFGLMLSYFKKKSIGLGESFDKDRYQKLLQTFGGDSDSGLAFLGDKRLFWYQENGVDLVAFQFAQKNNKLVVMGEPVGSAQHISKALKLFITCATRANLEILFYEIGQTTTFLLHEHGYEFMKFGEFAKVDLSHFTTEGKQGRRFRVVLNKLEKKGYQFEMKEPPYDQEFLDQLAIISDKWLNGRQEKGFSLGFFDCDYLQLSPIALIRNPEGNIIAFANVMPSPQEEVATIDLMRYDHEKSPNGIMDFLFIHLFLHFQQEGRRYFDLGMAPLSHVGYERTSFLEERFAYLIYSFSSRFYSFTGLRQYKEKFAPNWTPKYIAYPRQTWLLYDMLIIFMIDNQKVKKKESIKNV